MRVEITSDTFTHTEDLESILAVLKTFAKGRHDWHATIEEVESAASYLNSNAPSRAPIYRELGRKSIVDTSWQPGGGRADLVISSADIEVAATELCRPTIIVVENAGSDGAFIGALAQIFNRERIIKALENHWLEIRQAGGSGQVKIVAESESRKFFLRIRVVALYDSDSLMPGQQTQNHKHATLLEDLGITARVLERREAENYVPTKILSFCVTPHRKSRERLQHFKSLTPDQQNYLDIKSGRVSPGQEALYSGVPPATLRAIEPGFGDHVLRTFALHATTLDAHDLRSAKGELLSLLSSIETAL